MSARMYQVGDHVRVGKRFVNGVGVIKDMRIKQDSSGRVYWAVYVHLDKEEVAVDGKHRSRWALLWLTADRTAADLIGEIELLEAAPEAEDTKVTLSDAARRVL